jgi:excinuclease ABC subunit C
LEENLGTNQRLDFLRDKALKLSKSPGVYLMKDKNGKIIYIGKAKALKSRVSSYFNSNAANTVQSAKTCRLVGLIHDFDFIVTGSELDALVLEAGLIKQHNPKYNIKLKDATGYNYIKVSGGDYPKISYALQTDDKSATYIGPYASGFNIRQTVEETCRIFMLPSCNKKFPQEFGKSRPCLNYQIKRCAGICRGKISKEEYNAAVQNALDYIKNGAKASVKRLTAEMEKASEELNFEQAARLRDRINAIVKTETGQKIQTSKTTDYDIVTIAFDAELASAAVIKYRKGRLSDKENFFLGDEYEPRQMLSDFLTGYYDAETAIIPAEILVEEEPEDKELLEDFFTRARGKKVSIIIPKRGEGLTQVTLAKSNAREYLALKVGRSVKELGALEELAKLLGLAKPPLYIESYDISNMGEAVKVGGMVVYKNGKPFKANYRKFTIKDVAGLDDYACMKEVLRRRFTRYMQEDADAAFSVLPDLILLDGGKGHVSSVREVLNELNIDVRLFGMVKDEKHRTRAIAADGGEIQIAANKQVFGLLTKIQDEVHRFSATFQRAAHKKKSFELELTKVAGIGGKKAAAILKHFKTKQAIKEASAQELSAVAKIKTEKAEELKQFIEETF